MTPFYAVSADPVNTALSTALDTIATMIRAVLGPEGLRLIGISTPLAQPGLVLDPGLGPFVAHSVRGVQTRYTECYVDVAVTVVSAYYLAPVATDRPRALRQALDLYIPILRAHMANRQLGLTTVLDCLMESADGNTLTWGEGESARTYWGFKVILPLTLRVPLGLDWHNEESDG